MSGESALLVYPLSTIDEDPADLIAFDGIVAIPRQAHGPGFERAVTTIAFFQLNHQDLTTRRAPLLSQLWLQMESLVHATPGLHRQLSASIDAACSPTREFSACMNSFRALHAADPAKARILGEHALVLATT